jgi:hypothetical protein
MNSSCGAFIVALFTPRLPGGFRAKVDALMLLDRRRAVNWVFTAERNSIAPLTPALLLQDLFRLLANLLIGVILGR